MKISVVTVSFNSEATIAATLASVASQTYAHVEHIVIDGASQDGTQDIIRAQGGRACHLVSEPDSGIYDAMNKGLALASGDVVGLLNADDVFAGPQVLSQVAASFATPAAPDMVYGDLVYVAPNDDARVVRRWRSGPFSPAQLKFGWMPPHPTVYLRRTLLEAVGRFDTTLRIAADYDFMLRCLTRPGLRIAYLPHVLVHMRLGGASNRSLMALKHKSTEDLTIMRRHGIGGWPTLLLKNLRKLPQFLPLSTKQALAASDMRDE